MSPWTSAPLEARGVRKDLPPSLATRVSCKRGARHRSGDMLIIRGVDPYPSEVERILLTSGGVSPPHRLTSSIAPRRGTS